MTHGGIRDTMKPSKDLEVHTMKRGSFAAGFLTCLLLAGITTTAYAAGIMAERSHHRIVVDGKEAQMEAYVINGNNYVKLRDIGEQVCFNVYWDSDNGCVQVESGKPYTGTAPQQTAAAPTDGSRYVPKVGDVIRCHDSMDYPMLDIWHSTYSMMWFRYTHPHQKIPQNLLTTER